MIAELYEMYIAVVSLVYYTHELKYKNHKHFADAGHERVFGKEINVA